MKGNLWRKYIVIGTLIGIVATTLVGCGKSQTKVAEVTVVTDTTDEMATYFKSKPHDTITIIMYGNATQEALDEINKRLSSITNPTLNADVEIIMVGYGTYNTQLNMMLAAGDDLDLFAPLESVDPIYTAGQLQPIGHLLEQFGGDMLEIIDEKYWQPTTFDGERYGVPVNTEKADQLGFAMRKDICEALEIDYKNMHTLDDIYEALVRVKEAYPDIYPVVSELGCVYPSGLIGQDCIGDNYNLTVAENPYDKEPKVVNFFETDLFKTRVERNYKWQQEKLIMPDAATNTETALDLINAGKGFGFFSHMKPGWEVTNSTGGYELVSVRYTEPVATTNCMNWFVPVNSSDAERSVAFLNMLYSDPVVANLVVNGIEGEDYQIIDPQNGVINYPEGIDAENVPYVRNNWAWPNPQIAYLWEGEDLDIWQQYTTFNEQALVPTSYGFSFKSSEVINEITACLNIYDKYVNALYAGSLEPSSTIEKLNAEMKKAGIEAIINEKQEQLDEWLTKNKEVQ